MTGNTLLPSPVPALATVTTDLTALNAAEVVVRSRAPGAATARDGKLEVVVYDLRQLKSYVQTVADANPGNAAHVIQSAGMTVKTRSAPTKAPFAVKQGSVSGTILLAAKAVGDGAAYQWAWSLDQKTWTTLPDTIQAKTQAEGLTPATTAFFRVRPVTRKGEGNWSQIVSIVVK
jgi:hypothetical protein